MPLNARGWICAVALALMRVPGSLNRRACRSPRALSRQGLEARAGRRSRKRNAHHDNQGARHPRVRGSLPGQEDEIVLVVVFDAETSPQVLLRATEVPTDGKRIESNTSPPFGIRIRRIDTPR